MPAWLLALDHYFPIRYLVLTLCAVGALLATFTWVAFGRGGGLVLLCSAGVAIGVRDLSAPSARSSTWARSATSGSTTRCCRPRCHRTTSA